MCLTGQSVCPSILQSVQLFLYLMSFIKLFWVFDAQPVIDYVYYCQVIGEYEACEIPHFFFHFINI